jgi:hypothetical protein
VAAAPGADPAATLQARRFRAQALTGAPLADPLAVTRRLLAIQAQDLRGARLAIRLRTPAGALAATDVDAALDSGALLVSWLNRGTLHLIDRDDFVWLHALTTPQLATGNLRRLEQEGVSPAMAARGVEAVVAALAEEGPLLRRQLREHLEAAGVRTEGQALVHVLFAATLRGLIVRGPTRPTSGLAEQTFVLTSDWLGAKAARPPADLEVALGELARRFLAGHGPASAADLGRWAGTTLGAASRGLSLIAAELREQRAADGTTLVGLRSAPRAAGLPAPRLLGAFEPLLMGWISREPILGERPEIVTSNGIFRPFALVGGRAAATWKLAGGKVELDPFAPLGGAERSALEADAADVVRFLGR